MDLQALTREIEDRDDSSLEHELMTLHAHLSAATCRFLVTLREFDRRGAWAACGVVSFVQWLGWRCGIGAVAAREHIRVAHALANLPETSAWFAEGRVSYSKVRALTRVATVETEAFFLNVARYGTAEQMERIVRYARRGEAMDDPDRLRAMLGKCSCRWFYDDDGMLVVKARLMPDDGRRLVEAMMAMGERLSGQPRYRSPERLAEIRMSPHCYQSDALPIGAQRAAALAALAEAAQGLEPVGSVPEIVVHIRPDLAERVATVDRRREASGEDDSAEARDDVPAEPVHDSAEAPAWIEDGVAIPDETAHRLACDAAIVPILEDDGGEPLSAGARVGRRRRTIPPAIRRALQSRDAGCRFPGCSHTRFVHAHHVTHWAHGGETSLSNLVTLCTHHHKLVHEGGFSVRRTHADEFAFFTPDGSRIPEVFAVIDGTYDAVVAQHQSLGLDVSAESCRSCWDGRRIDYDWVMTVYFERPPGVKLVAPPPD